MTEIFLSYASSDRNKAEALVSALQRQGWAVFWDLAVPAGLTWDDYIGGKLDEAKCVVVAWSETAVRSRYVREEAREGFERRILVPVFFEKVKPPFGFGGIHAIDLASWDGDESAAPFRELVRAIGELLGATPTEATVEDRRAALADGPSLSRGLHLISYGPRPYHRPEMPYATEIKFRPEQSLHPARFRVACDAPIHDATAVLDMLRDGEWVDGFSYYESARIRSSRVLVVEVSDQPITPEDEFMIEARSAEPIHILEVRKQDSEGAQGIGFSAKPSGEGR